MKKRREAKPSAIAAAVAAQAKAGGVRAVLREPQQPPPYVAISDFHYGAVHVRSQADANQIIETLVRAMPHLKP